MEAAGINTNANGYILNAAPNVQFKSSGTYMELLKMQWMGYAVNPNTENDEPNKAVRSERSRWATMLTSAWQWARSAARNTL